MFIQQYMFIEQYTAQPFILIHVSSFRRPSIQRSIYGALHEPAHGVNGQLCRPCVHNPDNLPSLTVLSLLAAAREEALGNEVLGRSLLCSGCWGFAAVLVCFYAGDGGLLPVAPGF